MTNKTPLQVASRIRNNALGKAIESVSGRISARRLVQLRQETGFSAPQLLERLAHMKKAEIVRQTGLCYRTIDKYKERWGI